MKVPQVCWNRIYPGPVSGNGAWDQSPLKGVEPGEYFYFVHSFYARPESAGVILTETDYGGIKFCSGIRAGNIIAFQFHPERSGPKGLEIYMNIKNMLNREEGSSG